MILQQFLLLLEEKDNFKLDIGSMTPCDMILLWTPTREKDKQTMLMHVRSLSAL
jgi:hypothetical protein